MSQLAHATRESPITPTTNDSRPLPAASGLALVRVTIGAELVWSQRNEEKVLRPASPQCSGISPPRAGKM